MARPPVSAYKLAVALFLLAVASSGQPQGVTTTTVLLGQSAPLSGANKSLSDDIRNGALAYFKKINDAGGVNGRRIELVTLDDANDTKRAGENTRKLLEENSVLALFGYASATLSRPALPFVEKDKAPFLAPFTGADPMRAFNKYVYNMRASYADELEKIVDHYAKYGVKRFSIVHYDDVVGKENFSAGAVLVVPEYRAAIEKLLGRPEYSFTSLESYIAAKVTVEAIRRAGPTLTRETLLRALDGMSSYDVGGYVINFSPKNHNGSKFVDLTIIGKDLKFYN